MTTPPPPTVVTDVHIAFSRRLVTPEGLDLRLNLASAADRASAFIIDALIVVAVLIALTVLALAAGFGAGPLGGEIVVIIWLLGGFVLRNGYFVIFELGPRAATPGKRVCRLRVIARDGGPLTAEAIIARNALRELEAFLPLTLLAAAAIAGDPVDAALVGLGLVWTGAFLLFPLFNRDRLRVGDLVAGTWVVRAPRMRMLADLAQDAPDILRRFAFTVAQTDAYGVKELEILDEVIRRRSPKAMTVVADRIRTKIGFVQPVDQSDRAFLLAYYAALRARLEHRLLFGHRRRDKFDKA
jgi:uncharacterized RDD family membrane protein YckC